MYRSTVSALRTLEERHLAPISARASLIMDDLQDVTARARRVDDAVRAKLQGLDTAARVAKDVVSDWIWPVVGVARALSAGLRGLRVPQPNPAQSGRGGRLDRPLPRGS